VKITSEQLETLISELSKTKNIKTGVILRNFMLERFLERVSISDYKNNFILKGGMLIASMVGIDARSTMDMDAIIKGRTLSESEINKIIESILNIAIDDGVLFTLRDIKEIREEADYFGFRVSIEVVFNKIHHILKVDITTGDFVTPREIAYDFKLMFEDRSIGIMAYNLETILAEKLETIITRGVANTRMRDFYDIYILTRDSHIYSMNGIFNSDIFKAALKRTVEARDTAKRMTNANNIIQMIENSLVMNNLWQRYQKKFTYAASVSWEMAIEALKKLVQILMN